MRDTDPEIEIDVLDDTQDSERARVLLADEHEHEHEHEREREITPSQRAALDAEGRRIRERDAYEAGWRETLAKVDEAAGMLTPKERVRLGLENAKRGLVEGRALHERLTFELDRVRTDLADGEAQLRVLSTQARSARIPRVRNPHQESGPRRLPADVRQSVTERVPVDDRTRASLRTMGLAPVRHLPLVPQRGAPSAPEVAPEPPPEVPRTFLDRIVHKILYRTPEPSRGARLTGATKATGATGATEAQEDLG
jgi:hypothetical protein